MLKYTKTGLLGKISYWLWNHHGIPENELSKLNWNELEKFLNEIMLGRETMRLNFSGQKKRNGAFLPPRHGMNIGCPVLQLVTILYCLIFLGFTFCLLLLHTVQSINHKYHRPTCNIIRKSKYIIDIVRPCYRENF